MALSGRLTLLCSRIGRDDVIAFLEDALEGHVERVGAVEREDEAFQLVAVKELVEAMPAVVEGPLGGEGHLVARRGPDWPGSRGQSVHGLVDRLRLRKTRRGVVEINHGCFGCRRGVPPKGGTPTSGLRSMSIVASGVNQSRPGSCILQTVELSKR